jgi:CPA1 family monovalent cation:H+ antiporter
LPLDVEATVQALAWMLLGASLVGMLARWIRLPYTVALVLAGVLVEETHAVAVPHLEPRVLLFVFLPPLLFDAAFRLDDRELRAVMRPVLFLALPGTIGTAIVAGLLLWVSGVVPLGLALLFGSIVAATDPVAVVPVFRALNAPGRLSVIAEAESLINDGVAITLYTAFIGLATASGAPDVLGSLALFTREVVGGALIGGAMGIVFSRLTAAIDDHLIEMTLSTGLAYGSYLVAQSLETSGALACVAAGLVHGSYGRQVGMSERTRTVLDDLWEYFGFLANALVFLLVGFSASVADLLATGWPVLLAILAVVLARAVVVVLPGLLPARLLQTTHAERTVLAWGGLRGALTITLALALPADMPGRQLLIEMAFGVVLFTLLVQGVTLSLVLQRAGLVRPA